MENKVTSLKDDYDSFVSEVEELGAEKVRRLGVEGHESGPTKINIALVIRLGHRLKELTSEIKESSNQMSQYSAGLVLWTKVIACITAVYVIITGLLLLRAWNG